MVLFYLVTLVKGPGVLNRPTARPDVHEPGPIPPPRTTTRRDLVVAAACGAFVASMVSASFAADTSFYDWFCRVTGFGAHPDRDRRAPGGVSTAGSRCASTPMSRAVCPGASSRSGPRWKVKLGEVVTVDYIVTNLAARETVWRRAATSLRPLPASISRRSTASASPTRRWRRARRGAMTVVFYVDPSLAKDRGRYGLNTITLSYTFIRSANHRPGADRALPSRQVWELRGNYGAPGCPLRITETKEHGRRS
ncbi:MAG: cytochrome c oxidase assembly protein [Pseudorhodoplanes sp.]|nr:cytochrome c oxidase assembly protein [Pseudorhodoplanes sp.]